MFGIKESDFDYGINNSLLRTDMSDICDMKKKGQSLVNVVDPEFVEREKERFQRSQLNSSDGDAVELHDQVEIIQMSLKK